MNIVIIGTGGHGRVILDIVRQMTNDKSQMTELKVVGFADDNEGLKGKIIDGVEVLGTTEDLFNKKIKNIDGVVIGIGDNKIRAKFFERYREFGFRLPNVIHPLAIISGNVIIGEGVVIMPGVIVNTGTRVGDGVAINTGATVDHDNILNDFCHIYPGANLTGGVDVGKYTYVGTNASINSYKKIGDNCFVGTGAVVTKDFGNNVLVTGIPASVKKESL